MTNPPPFRVTARAVGHLLGIERLLGRLEGLEAHVPQPRLRRRNRIRSAQGSVAIEGNPLSIEQVTALLDGRRVAGPAREVLEVQNALRAYEVAKTLPLWSTQTVLRAHRLLMAGLAADAGRWRSGNAGIFRGTKVRHVAPKASFVPGLMRALIKSLRADRQTPMPVKACVAHYELQFIHPFSDGNGRVGRLWQHVILVHESPLFELVPVESLVQRRQKAYYAALAKADAAAEATPFVEFMLGCLRDSLEELASEFRVMHKRPQDRLAQARATLSARWFSRLDYLRLFKGISTATASRDLHGGVRHGQLDVRGKVATTRYRFKTPPPRPSR